LIINLTILNKVLSKGFNDMANNFAALSAAIDAVVAGIQEVAAAIANPAVDNNDQTVIDGFTAKLTAAADALKAATAAENAEDTGTTAPTTPPTDGSGSPDVQP
jgi:cell division GTPase FtsZ